MSDKADPREFVTFRESPASIFQQFIEANQVMVQCISAIPQDQWELMEDEEKNE